MTESLIARLEALTGPDREIDAEIALANGWTKPNWDANPPEAYWRSPDGRMYTEPPRYAESLDAALTLLSEGCEDWTVCRDNKRGLDCWASIGSEDMAPAYTAHTPAIALLIAIMKAKEESKP